MKNFILFIISFLIIPFSWGQCHITGKIIQDTLSDVAPDIYCGQSIRLEAEGYGDGTVILSENFNNGSFGPGWGSTPGSVDFSNPCSPNGVDGTPHAWMGNNTTVPRIITSTAYDLTSATAGVTICFDLLFATQGGTAPCEGPDEPQEGVYLQYSTDGGTTWNTIHYFDPNGGNDPQLTNWNNWCFSIPPAAITNNTTFRWYQDNDSGQDYDHWGIDNVSIVQNDVTANITWGNPGDSYYYSYGAGNPGGLHPSTLTPTTTTTYHVQIQTGTGDICKDSVTIVVHNPIYSSTVAITPDTVCEGQCAQATGDIHQVINPGGPVTFSNNETAVVATGQATVDINVQGLNMPTINPGSIMEVCINHFQFSGTQLCTSFGGCPCNGSTISIGQTCNLDASGFTITLTSPGGCTITLVPSGNISSGTIDGMCFVPTGGAPISSGSGNYTGQFSPQDPLSNLNGCQSNGVWTMTFNSGSAISFGAGYLTGWSIQFDNPPINYPATASWNPTAGVATPNSANTQICPPNVGDNTYTMTVSNGNAACATQDYPFNIYVDNCNCTQPNITVTSINTCTSPADLATVVTNSSGATLTYYSTQNDAQNATNAIPSSVTTSGSYWVRAENPTDPTCFTLKQIDVTIAPLDASFSFPNFCPQGTNAPTNITTTGGTFTFDPAPTDGATINANTGVISGATSGTSYSVKYTVGTGSCQQSHTETTNATGFTYSVVVTDANCGSNDGSIVLTPNGGTSPYTYSIDNGTTNQSSGTFNNLGVGSYSIYIKDNNGCTSTGTENVSNIGGPTITDSTIINPSCNGLCDGSESITVSGGTAPYTYSWKDSLGNTVGGNSNTISNLCAGNYTVTVTDNGGGSGCSIVHTYKIQDPAALDASFSGLNTTYCVNDPSVTMSSTQAGGIFHGRGVSGNTFNPTTAGIGNDTITHIVTNGTCSDTAKFVVNVISGPTADFTATPTQTTTNNTSVVFTNNSSNATNYSWNYGDNSSLDSTKNPTHQFPNSHEGSYIVILTATDNNGCSAKDQITINIISPDLDYEIPNVFTPNGDDKNDYFEFVSYHGIKEIKLVVLNRWGNVVFESNEANFQWNGKEHNNGNECSDGVYFYKMQIIGENGKTFNENGFVHLARN